MSTVNTVWELDLTCDKGLEEFAELSTGLVCTLTGNRNSLHREADIIDCINISVNS